MSGPFWRVYSVSWWTNPISDKEELKIHIEACYEILLDEYGFTTDRFWSWVLFDTMRQV